MQGRKQAKKCGAYSCGNMSNISLLWLVQNNFFYWQHRQCMNWSGYCGEIAD